MSCGRRNSCERTDVHEIGGGNIPKATAGTHIHEEVNMRTIPIHAHVLCTDGDAGTSTALIVDPVRSRLTDIVVREHGVEDTERIVSVSLITESSEDMIRLGCTRSEVHGFDGFIEAHFTEATSPEPPEGPSSAWSNPFPIIVSKRIPDGEVALGRRSKVEALDGPVGHLESLIIDGADGHIAYLIVRTRKFPTREEAAVSAEHVEWFPDYLYLRLTRADLARLPHAPLHEGALLPALGSAGASLAPESPEEAGVEDTELDASHLEGAHLLAEEVRTRLHARGFTDEQVLDWAKAFLHDQHSGGKREFLAWIKTRESGAPPRNGSGKPANPDRVASHPRLQ
jgi:hypothetical protein